MTKEVLADITKVVERHGWADVLLALRSCAEHDAEVYDPESHEVEALALIVQGLKKIIKGT